MMTNTTEGEPMPPHMADNYIRAAHISAGDKWAMCPTCFGTGGMTEGKNCPTCKGQGGQWTHFRPHEGSHLSH